VDDSPPTFQVRALRALLTVREPTVLAPPPKLLFLLPRLSGGVVARVLPVDVGRLGDERLNGLDVSEIREASAELVRLRPVPLMALRFGEVEF